jgi:hypothetical protein
MEEYPLNSIGADIVKKSYIKYLMKIYTNLITKDDAPDLRHKGAIIRQKVKSRFKNNYDFVYIEKFDKVAHFVCQEIHNTVKGREKMRSGEKLYVSFREYLEKLDDEQPF